MKWPAKAGIGTTNARRSSAELAFPTSNQLGSGYGKLWGKNTIMEKRGSKVQRE